MYFVTSAPTLRPFVGHFCINTGRLVRLVLLLFMDGCSEIIHLIQSSSE